MKLQQLPARQGIVWVRQGFRLFVRQPLGFSGLFASFLFVVFLVMLLPLVGPFLLLALLPLGSLGFMIAARTALDGRFPLPRVFIEPLRSGRQRALGIVKLGAIYAIACIAISALSEWLDGGALEALMETMGSGKATPEDLQQRLAEPSLMTGLAVRLGLAGLLAVPFWHAPALVHWAEHGVAKSLFSSTVACWRNRGAFTVFALTWTAVVLVFGIVANLLAALLGQPQLVAFVAMPLSLVLSTIFYTSIYFSFADCFALDPSGDSP
jgi:hypothetical protein